MDLLSFVVSCSIAENDLKRIEMKQNSIGCIHTRSCSYEWNLRWVLSSMSPLIFSGADVHLYRRVDLRYQWRLHSDLRICDITTIIFLSYSSPCDCDGVERHRCLIFRFFVLESMTSTLWSSSIVCMLINTVLMKSQWLIKQATIRNWVNYLHLCKIGSCRRAFFSYVPPLYYLSTFKIQENKAIDKREIWLANWGVVKGSN